MFILYAILFLLCLVILLLAIAAIRAIMLKPYPAAAEIQVDNDRALKYAENLSELIQKETISARGDEDITKFLAFHETLKDMYPLIHKHCEKMVFDGSLLFKWSGKSSKDPIMFMSHHDVVEASGKWDHPAFSGEILDYNGEKVVFGRGTVDTKASLSCFLQATEELLADGIVPECDVYLASSCTEEIGGKGAPLINDYLMEQGVHLKMLIDEGGMMLEEPLAGAKGVFAMVGVVEKGYGDVKFIAKGNGGHASAPPKNTPIARLSSFVCDIEKNYPFTSRFSPAATEMFTRLSPGMPFLYKMIFANLWLFKPLLCKLMPAISSQGAAMIRTTTAFTMQQGSDGYNVIPQEAFLTANMRFISHQGPDESLDIIRTIAKKHDIEMEELYIGIMPPEVDFTALPFKELEGSIQEHFPGVTVVPYVMTGGTDARFFSDVCDNCLRFAPLKINKQQLNSVHGLNENLCIDSLPGAVDFYKSMVKAQKSR